jgi:Flp pilus assembly protein TadB
MSDTGMPGGDRRPDVEIIPPDRGRTRSGRAQSRVWISINTSRRQGPGGMSGLFGIILAVLVVTFVTAVVLMLLLGALLIWVPVVAVVVAALLVIGILRKRFGSRHPDDASVPGETVRGPDTMP